MTDTVSCTRSEFAESILQLDGHQFSLNDFPFYRKIYDDQYHIMVMKCGRQVAKSTTICNRGVTNCAVRPHFRTLYVAPSRDQAKVFSTSRVDPTIKHTPSIASLTPTGVPLNVSHKRFINGSEFRIGYGRESGDRLRGISSDEVCWDEVQDIQIAEVSPVVNECMANSKFGYEIYAGTPKSMENGLEILWQRSSQDEWVVPCFRCNKWNTLMSSASMGLNGVICVNCGGALNPRNGMWHSMNPDAKTKGYHISQLMLPMNSEDPQRWKRLLHKLETYEESKFLNEVMGISDAKGTRMVSLAALRAGCQDYQLNFNPDPVWDLPDDGVTVAGVDWSGGGHNTFVSRTALWIANFRGDGTVKTLFFKIFHTNNAVEDVREVARICDLWGVRRVIGDAGGGAVANSYLADVMGEHRVAQAQYGSFAQQIKWNQKDRYLVDKTAAIDTVMRTLRDGNYIFPRMELCAEVFADILAEYETVTQQGQGKKIWTHSPIVPDDALHAMTFCWVAAQLEIHGTAIFYR